MYKLNCEAPVQYQYSLRADCVAHVVRFLVVKLVRLVGQVLVMQLAHLGSSSKFGMDACTFLHLF